MWVYSLKLKSDVFNDFQMFKALAKSKFGCQITTLRIDNGGEFYSQEFKKYCTKHDMKRKFTTPYTRYNSS